MDQSLLSQSSPRRAALRIALIYGAIASAWILGSGWLLRLVVVAPDALVLWEIWKGLGFVGFTSILLFALLQRHLRLERESERRFTLLVENLPGMVYRCDNDRRWTIRYASQAAERLTGYPPRALIGNAQVAYGDLICPDDRERVWEAVQRAVKTESVFQVEYRLVRRDGVTLSVWEQGRAIEDPAHPGQLVLEGLMLDVTERTHAESVAQEARATLETALASMSDAVMISDAKGHIIHLNAAFARFHRFESLADCPRQLDAYSKLLDVSFADGSPSPVSQWAIPRALSGETATDQTYRLRRKDTGESWIASYSLAPIRGADGKIIGSVVTGRDVTQERVHQEELDRIAHHDPLTGLPNRRLLTDRLEQAIALADRSGTAFAVCYLDLDGFKPINDRYGHGTGDRFLVEVAAALRGILRAHDTVARLGGDEFVLLLTQLQQPEDCFSLLQRVLSRISQPIVIDEVIHGVTGSLGVTLYPGDAVDPDTLLRHADQAMYHAKEAGRNRFQFYDPEQGRAVQALEQLHQQLRQALARSELVLHYQPQVDLISREVTGVEALIRWQHPEQGLLPPAAFMPVIEGGPLEIAVGDWVIATALDQLELWRQQGLRLQLGINVGPGQLMGLGFTQRLKQQLDRRPAIAASALEIEIVESTAFSDFEQATQVMEACRALGVRFALDDFGTGYSSLAHFRTLPVDRLKIDKSFVRDMLHDPGDLEIVESVVRLAQAFDRAVIAEGVETLEHAAVLPSLSCHYAQGYGIARPMPAAQLPEWVQDWAAQPRLPLAEETWGHHDVRLVVATQHYLRRIEGVASLLEDESRPNDQRSSTVECTFGQWYRGRGFARYGELAEYEAVGVAHERSHALADELLALARGGQPEAARARLHELKALRDELLAAMSALMRRVRESEGRQAAEGVSHRMVPTRRTAQPRR